MKKVPIVFLSLMLFANQPVFGVGLDIKKGLGEDAKKKVPLRLPRFKKRQSNFLSARERSNQEMEQRHLVTKYSESLRLLGNFVNKRLPDAFSEFLKKRSKFLKKIRKKIKGMGEEEKRFFLSRLAEVLIKAQIGRVFEIIDITDVGYTGKPDWFKIEGPNGPAPFIHPIGYGRDSSREEYNVHNSKTLKRVLAGFQSKVLIANELLSLGVEECQTLGLEILKHSLMAIRILKSKKVTMSVLGSNDFKIEPKNIWDAMNIYLDPVQIDDSGKIYDYNPDVIEVLKESFIEDVLQKRTKSIIAQDFALNTKSLGFYI